jgi:hypothetical protein
MRARDWLRRYPLAALVLLLGSGLGAFGFALGMLPFPSREHEPSPKQIAVPSEEVLCGPRALLVASCLMGRPVEFAEVLKLCRLTSAGASIGDLKQAAQELGLNAESRIADWPTLVAHRGAAILLLKSSHFVTINPAEPVPDQFHGRMRIFDPGRSARWTTQSELEAAWKGETIFLSRVSSPAAGSEAGPVLGLEAFWHDRGAIPASTETARYLLAFQNLGQVPLKISVAGSSCGCARSDRQTIEIPPGSKQNVEPKVALRGKRGYFSEYIAFNSNDSNHRDFKVWLCGAATSQEILSAKVLNLGDIAVGQTVSKELVVYDSGTGELRVKRVRIAIANPEVAPKLALNATIQQIESEDAAAKLHVAGRYRLRAGDYLIRVKASPSDGCALGPLAGQLELETNLPSDLAKLSCALEGAITPDVAWLPQAVVLQLVRGTKSHAAIRLWRPSGRDLTVSRATVTDHLPSLRVALRTPKPGLSEDYLDLDYDDSLGNRKLLETMLEVELMQGAKARIPVMIVRE